MGDCYNDRKRLDRRIPWINQIRIYSSCLFAEDIQSFRCLKERIVSLLRLRTFVLLAIRLCALV